MQLRTLLVPIDFSERSKSAAQHAAAFAERFQARLVLLHVIPHLAYEAVDLGRRLEPDAETIAKARNQLARLAAELPGKVESEKQVAEGDAPAVIEATVQQQEADLVIMPTHGYGRFRQFLLGSVTAKVLHDISCPILTGAHVQELPPFAETPYQRIACAIDLSDKSRTLLEWARDFSAAWNAELTVIYAAPKFELVVQDHLVGAHWHHLVAVEAKERIEKLLKEIDCSAEIVTDNGHIVPFVTAQAKEASADVLIIGRGRSQNRLGQLATHAYALIRESPCAVISI